jgi:uncharacterized protein (TIGR02996 family)
VASLIVAVDPGREVHAGDFAQLEYLDACGTLFVLAGTRVIAFHDGPLEDDSELEHVDHDIAALIPRIGDVPTTPRILPPSDVVLLRYALGLPVDDPEPEAVGTIVRDAMTAQLRAAVWDELAADGPRLVYADYLASRGDPRGELINLQLARNGGAVTARERRLLHRHAFDCIEELRPYLYPEVELARGFVVRCATRHELVIPPDVLEHRSWSTVEDLATTHVALARSRRLVSAHTLRTRNREVTELCTNPAPLPFETLLGWRAEGYAQPGILPDATSWALLKGRGAFERLRALSLDARDANVPFQGFERTPLGRALEQLDVHTELPPHLAITLRDTFEHSELPLLTIRIPHNRDEVCFALAHTEHGTRLSVQLEAPLDRAEATALVRRLAPLATGLRRVVIEDLGDPANAATRQREVLGRLAPLFREVVVRDVPAERLAL